MKDTEQDGVGRLGTPFQRNTHRHTHVRERQREGVSKGQRFYWALGAVGEVMAVASADWLGKGQSPVNVE